MKKENISVTVNDVLEALAIRVNDVLRPDRKSKNKKNNAYFWAFKFLFLLLLVWLVSFIFNNLETIGVSLIYAIGKSLRSVLSIIWVSALEFIKGVLILYLFYDNLKIFTSSTYYDNLYESQRKLRHKKNVLFKGIEIFLKVLAVFFMITIAALGAVSLFALIILFIMLAKNIYIISPIIITGSVFMISFLTFMHIKNRFFDNTQTIKKNHFILAFVILVIGVVFFWYETSSYEYANKLPDEMELTQKETVFKLEEGKKINLKSYSKLDNITIIYDDSLGDNMVVNLEYYKTADVRYMYDYNDYDDLNISFTSKLNFEADDVQDVFKLLYSTFNRKTIYNYNLFKYPNIYVHVSSKYRNDITIK